MTNLRDDKPLIIGWCVSSLSLNVASVRYRAMLPVIALEATGHTCHIFTSTTAVDLELLDVLVVVKDFSVEAYQLIQRAKSSNIPVIFDLCDNIFVKGYGKNSANVPSEIFLAMSQFLDGVVVTTAPLAEVVANHIPNIAISVIPDGVISDTCSIQLDERLAVALARVKLAPRNPLVTKIKRVRHMVRVYGSASLLGLAKKWATRARRIFTFGFWRRRAGKLLALAKRSVAAKAAHNLLAPPALSAQEAERQPSPNVSSLLWFGNHGAEYANFGMLDLLLIKDELETVAKTFDVELVVVSNNLQKYNTYIRPLAITSRYVEWSPRSVEQEMQRAKVVLIPNSLDDFSICKSANRSVHALTHDLPVVATNTPSLLPLLDGLSIDNFLDGLTRYLSSSQHVAEDVAKGKELAVTNFGPATIRSAWLVSIQAAASQVSVERAVPDIIFVLNLIQDIELALPIIAEAQRRSIKLDVWSSSALLKKYPHIITTLKCMGISPVVVLESEINRAPAFKLGTRAMLTVTETNLAPHSLTRILTERANKAGLKTATLQHGFENVGLTYSDDIHHIRKVNFASQKIYLWGPLDTLHSRVRSSTVAKCISVGCPKVISSDTANLDQLIPPAATVIGIFENLHWHRYSESYRSFFIKGVETLAENFPHLVFLIKPHNAGLWLTKRYKGEKPVAPNLLIADPESAAWRKFSADQLLGRVSAVITSPSTIALDAARKGLSVAVVAHGLELEQYAPLASIRNDADWSDFVTQTVVNRQLDERSSKFVSRNVVGDAAVSNILNDLII